MKLPKILPILKKKAKKVKRRATNKSQTVATEERQTSTSGSRL